jgi:hypothetical protein
MRDTDDQIMIYKNILIEIDKRIGVILWIVILMKDM